MSVIGPKIGMSERQFQATTLIADVVHMEGDLKVYRANRAYYYFDKSILTKVSQTAPK